MLLHLQAHCRNHGRVSCISNSSVGNHVRVGLMLRGFSEKLRLGIRFFGDTPDSGLHSGLHSGGFSGAT